MGFDRNLSIENSRIFPLYISFHSKRREKTTNVEKVVVVVGKKRELFGTIYDETISVKGGSRRLGNGLSEKKGASKRLI